jgi:hypothetical protein
MVFPFHWVNFWCAEACGRARHVSFQGRQAPSGLGVAERHIGVHWVGNEAPALARRALSKLRPVPRNARVQSRVFRMAPGVAVPPPCSLGRYGSVVEGAFGFSKDVAADCAWRLRVASCGL